MLTLLAALRRARSLRPLLWWVLALLIYVVAPVPQEWVLVLIVGLGVALAVTVSRLRERVHGVTDHVQRGWQIADRLVSAAEDRIRGHQAVPQLQPMYGPAPLPAAGSYDPGALLSAIVAVLSAEGLPTNAAAGLPACAQLLAWQNITPQPGVPAPTADGLIRALGPGPRRPDRSMPPALLAQVVRVVLTHDQVLPPQIGIDAADDLIEASAHILAVLGISPDNNTSGLDRWPVIAQILSAPSGY
ncbi:MAG: hypothetical protein ACRDTD_19650 [Pseudonocardiaceae bacterium]